jgi:hypothetical protein
MSGLSDIVMRMLDAGCDRQLIADMLDYVDHRIAGAQAASPIDSARTKRQDRNRRYYEAKRLKSSEQDVSDGNKTHPASLKDPEPKLTNVENNQIPTPPESPWAGGRPRRAGFRPER